MTMMAIQSQYTSQSGAQDGNPAGNPALKMAIRRAIRREAKADRDALKDSLRDSLGGSPPGALMGFSSGPLLGALLGGSPRGLSSAPLLSLRSRSVSGRFGRGRGTRRFQGTKPTSGMACPPGAPNASPTRRMTPSDVPPVKTIALDERAAASSPLQKARSREGLVESERAAPVIERTTDGCLRRQYLAMQRATRPGAALAETRK